MMSEAPKNKPLVDDLSPGIGSRFIRALLNRHGVAPMRHVTLVAEILAVHYTGVHRRMKGEVGWELEEIEKVGAHFGESLAKVFSETTEADFVPAVLAVDGAKVSCQLLVGDVVREPDANSLVAIRVGAQWVVLTAPQGGVGPCYEVRQMTVLRSAARKKRIAVLDDDLAEAASLAEHFADRGCEAQAFTSAEELLAHMKFRPFDGFVIDWVLHEGTALELIALLRAEDRECPIAILTGKMEEDVRVEPAVAEALSTYKLLFFQKPTRPQLISSQMLRTLAAE